MNIFLIILSAGLFAAGRFFDIYTSQDGQMYATGEANKLWRDKNGYFDTTKNVIWSGIFGAGLLTAAILIPHGWIGLMIVGISSMIVAYRNHSLGKSNRAVQTETLRMLRAGQFPSMGTVTTNVNTHYSYVSLFPWIITLETDYSLVITKISDELVRVAALPEDQWFIPRWTVV